jgi:hypothetical protein
MKKKNDGNTFGLLRRRNFVASVKKEDSIQKLNPKCP